MLDFENLCRSVGARGLQAMMFRWEQKQPVNAVQVAWLQDSFRPSEIQSAATRVLQRLLRSKSGRGPDEKGDFAELFDFQHAAIVGDWVGRIQSAVTDELNTPYLPGRPVFRVSAFDLPKQGQFLLLGYRHAIADARSISLLLNEMTHSLTSPEAQAPRYAATINDQSLSELFPEEYRWSAVPGVVWHAVTELWKSLWCRKLEASDPADLRMEFRLHQLSLPLATLKAQCRHYGVTLNDLILAAMMEWFAREFPGRKSLRNHLAAATLVDLSGRAPESQPYAFGQFLTSFAARAPITAELPFDQIVRLVAHQTQACKRISPLLHSARGFELMAREWDLVPLVRRPTHLPAAFPLFGGISNVNLPAVIGETNDSLRNYFRGTCVTNLLPMMLSITTVRDSCSLTTTYRPAIYTAAQMDDLAAHLGHRLFGQAASVRRAAA